MREVKKFSLAFAAVLGACLLAAPAFADGASSMSKGKGGGPPIASPPPPCGQNSDGTYCWMSPDIGTAWANGWKGAGTAMTFVDDFSSSSTFSGDLGLGTQTQRHGEWTTEQAGLIAPESTIFRDDFSTEFAVVLQPGVLNIVNASYGLVGKSAFYSSSVWSSYPQEQSMIEAAQAGTALISKAAGNDAVAVGTASKGSLDYLNVGLIGTLTAIFVGALDHNGTPLNPASLASYSNYAGSNVDVQNHFLAVGVEGDKTGLYGTSFAAPVISGYAALLGEKFPTANATLITNQLLDTARTDTLVNYNAATYGRGEASLTNALAPDSIW